MCQTVWGGQWTAYQDDLFADPSVLIADGHRDLLLFNCKHIWSMKYSHQRWVVSIGVGLCDTTHHAWNQFWDMLLFQMWTCFTMQETVFCKIIAGVLSFLNVITLHWGYLSDFRKIKVAVEAWISFLFLQLNLSNPWLSDCVIQCLSSLLYLFLVKIEQSHAGSLSPYLKSFCQIQLKSVKKAISIVPMSGAEKKKKQTTCP